LLSKGRFFLPQTLIVQKICITIHLAEKDWLNVDQPGKNGPGLGPGHCPPGTRIYIQNRTPDSSGPALSPAADYPAIQNEKTRQVPGFGIWWDM